MEHFCAVTYPVLVIFGEIVPQSICVRYGLPIGAWMSPFVLSLMYIMAPVAWPTAKLLDYLLGEDHGTVYKKAGLKTLVDLHRTMGDAGQQLNSDEVTIISAVLDLKEKSVGSIMTPMDDVFTLSADNVLDEETMDLILSQGYSRVPIHAPDNDKNFVGMLLVKMLITYDPEDCKPVRDFALATLPETRAETSCLDIVNFFQEGKSHMVLVSDNPGDDHGALGVVTLEDVIEELIGEEIIDESDVFVDVHKAIRRLAPAPRTRVPKGQIVADAANSTANGHEGNLIDIDEGTKLSPVDLQKKPRNLDPCPLKVSGHDYSQSPRRTVPYVRRRSSGGSQVGEIKASRRANTGELREHLKHLGPSNLASRPKATRWTSVKIKPGSGADMQAMNIASGYRTPPDRRVSESASSFQGGIGEGLLHSGGVDAKDGVQALQQGYGGTSHGSPVCQRPTSSASKGIQAYLSGDPSHGPDLRVNEDGRSRRSSQRPSSRSSALSRSESIVGDLPDRGRDGSKSPRYTLKGPARTGSITENVVDSNGIRKVVLEMTSSSSNDEEESSGATKGTQCDDHRSESPKGGKLRGGGAGNQNDQQHSHPTKRKRRRKRKQVQTKGESEPLLGGNR
jgi:metal transporter CNNM